MWYKIELHQPDYYEVVDAVLNNGERTRIWKAWDDESGEFIYTIFDTMNIVDVRDIDRWKSNI